MIKQRNPSHYDAFTASYTTKHLANELYKLTERAYNEKVLQVIIQNNDYGTHYSVDHEESTNVLMYLR